jgi:hypothetical protein
MKASGLILFMLTINLFFYFGASAIGLTPYTNSTIMNAFWKPDATNITQGTVVQNATFNNKTMVSTDTNVFTQIISGMESFVYNLLSPISGLLAFIEGCFLMPFTIADMMNLQGAAKWIPAVIYYAMLVFALASLMTGRDA